MAFVEMCDIPSFALCGRGRVAGGPRCLRKLPEVVRIQSLIPSDGELEPLLEWIFVVESGRGKRPDPLG